MPSKRRLVTSELCFALEKAGLLDFSYNNYALGSKSSFAFSHRLNRSIKGKNDLPKIGISHSN